jgi:hypothetical protein
MGVEMGNFIRSAISAVMTILGLAAQIGAIALHVWTIIIAYNHAGFFLALVTFAVPGLSEIFWLYTISSAVGVLNWYAVACASIIGLWVVVFALSYLSTLLEERLIVRTEVSQ